MKIMGSGDHHWRENSRFAETVAVHTWMIEEAARRKIDLFLSGGDIYESLSTPKERSFVAAWLQGMAEICPVVIAKGNHDREQDCAIMQKLRSKHPILVEERCGVYVVGGAAVGVVAWPRKAILLASAGAVSQETASQVAGDALRNVLRGLGAQLARHTGPRILLGHFMVDGARTSVGQPLVGVDMNVGLSDLSLASPHLTLMAHVHCPQEYVLDNGSPAIYVGSPRRTAFGEVEDKGVVVAEFDGSRLLSWERVKTPCAPMLLLEDEWRDGWSTSGHGLPESQALKGADIRFRYRVASDARDAAKRSAAEFKAWALALEAASVQVEEEVISTVVARAPEVAAAKTLGDKLAALWRVRNEVIAPDRVSRLLERARSLEES